MLKHGAFILIVFFIYHSICYGADMPFRETRKVRWGKDTVHTYEHTSSGLSVVWVENEDERKSFTLGVKTPAENSTGVNHIIEHTVFTGSKNYPSARLFFDASGAYPHLFMNALTSGDMTIYPFATPYKACYMHLLNIYLDSIFNPNMLKDAGGFYEESFNYDAKKGSLGGVVYNEMKGTFNSADRIIYRTIRDAVYQGTHYANDSGGDPNEIPKLTYDDFIKVYKKYYYPANMKVILYGDLQIEEIFSIMDSYLKDFPKKESNVSLYAAFTKGEPYQKHAVMPEGEKTCIIKSFVIPKKLETKELTELDIWIQAYLLNPHFSFQKQMREHGLTNVKFFKDDDLPYPVYSVIVQDIPDAKAREVSGLLDHIFKEAEKEWIRDKQAEEDAISEAKLSLIDEEHHTNRGIEMAQSILDGWAHERDEMQYFIQKNYIKKLKQLKMNYASLLFHEAYCVTLQLTEGKKSVTDPLTLSQVDQKEWSDIIDNMEKWQSRNSNANLEPISLKDLVLEPQVKTSIKLDKEVIYLMTKVPKGLARSQLYYNTSHIKKDQLPFMFLYTYLLEESAKELLPFKGALEAKCLAYNNEEGYSPFLKVSVISGEDEKDHGSLFLRARENLLLKDDRWYQHKLMQFKSRFKEGWSSNILSALSSLNMGYEEGAKRYLYEQGYPLYKFCEGLSQMKENSWISKIKAIDAAVYNRNGLVIATAVPSHPINLYERSWNKVIKRHPRLEVCEPDYDFERLPQNRVLINDTQVDYIYLQYTKPKQNLDGIDYLAAAYLSKYYLNPEIRIKLGAYGAGCQLGGLDTIAFYTYRDPSYEVLVNILKDAFGRLSREIDPKDLAMSKIEALARVHQQFRLLASEMDQADMSERNIMMGVKKDYITNLQHQIIAGTPKEIEIKALLFKKIGQEGALGIATNKNKKAAHYYKIYHFK